MEIWGGNGYVENAPMARLYREAPVNSIWEGSGNVMCLDVLRAIEREPEGCALLLADLNHGASTNSELLGLLASLRSDLARAPQQRENMARLFAQRLVLVAQAGLMLRHTPAPIAEAFIVSRTDAGCGRVFGTLSVSELLQQNILNRAWPM